MTKAGHSDMKTTKRYMHLAGVVFRDEAAALERRLLGVTTQMATQDDVTPGEPVHAVGVDGRSSTAQTPPAEPALLARPQA